jgi:integrase
LLAHLDGRREPGPSSLVKVRRHRRGRPPLLLPAEIQAIIDGCATWDDAAGEWRGNLRDRLIFSLLAESGMRLGEVLGMAISDFVMGRGGTAYIEVVPREGNPNGARVKMMRPRRIYVSADLERLFADYLTHLACRAAGLGMDVSPGSPLLVNLDRPPLLAVIREGTVRDKVTALKKKGVGPAGWTPHWFRHSHASALLLAGTPEWVVSRRLGHAHVQTTIDLYGWVREDDDLRAAANWKSYTSSWQVPGVR